MFDKDKEYGNRIDQQFALGEPFVLLGVRILPDTVKTSFGDTEAVELLCQRLSDEGFAIGSEITCQTVASAIVDKARDAEDDEFPAVVELRKVHSKTYKTAALALQFVSPYYPAAERVRPS